MVAGEIAAWCAFAGMGLLACLVFWRRPPEPVWPSIFFVYVFAAIWALGEIYTSFHATEQVPYHIGLMANYFGLLMVVPTWWVFTYSFAEHLGIPFKNQNRLVRYGPFGIAMILWLLLATNPFHGQFLTPIVGARNEYKIFWYIAAGYNYLLLLATSARFIQLRWRARRSTIRGQVNILLAATLLPAVCNMLFVLGLVNTPFDLTVTAFTISGFLFLIGIYRDRLFALSPVALQHVIRNERDGILIVDANYKLLHNNPAADRFFDTGELAPYSDVLDPLLGRLHLSDVPDMVIKREAFLEALEHDSKLGINTIYGYTNSAIKFVHVELNEVPNFRGEILLRVLRLRDVTAETLAEKSLRDIAHRFSTVSGNNYFTELARYLSRILEVRYVIVGRIEHDDPKRIYTITLCENDRIIPNVDYEFADIPPHHGAEDEFRWWPDDQSVELPATHILSRLGAIIYAGIPLADSAGNQIGVLAVMHDAPLENEAAIESTLKIFAPRSASELQRLLIEQELEASRKLLYDAQEIADIGAWQWDIRANTVVWSSTTYRVYGQDPDSYEPDTETLNELVHPDDRERVQALIQDAIRRRDSYEVEHRVVRQDGSVGTVLTRGHLYLDDQDKPSHIIGTTQDITERRQLESQNIDLEKQLLQSQKLESLGTLAGGIAHDFNNILQAILGYNALALEYVSDDPTLRKYLMRVDEGSRRATDLVRQILTFSGQDEFELKEIKLADVIRDAVEFLNHAIPSTIHLECDITEEPCLAMAGPVQIHQLVTNLCTNSMHAMDDRQGTLSVSLRRREIAEPQSMLGHTVQPGTYGEIIVKDTGAGIAPGNVARLFDPFFTTKEVGKGTGLGLAVVHGIVRRLNGGIAVETELGEGTTVSVLLPVSSTASPVKQSIISGTPASSMSGNGHRRVLVVDDEVAITQFLKTVLEKNGHDVVAFNDPVEALDYVKTSTMPDLALLDYTMPKLTGIELAAALNEIDPEMTVIIATGNLDVTPLEEVKPPNVRALLRKPFRVEDILSMTKA